MSDTLVIRLDPTIDGATSPQLDSVVALHDIANKHACFELSFVEHEARLLGGTKQESETLVQSHAKKPSLTIVSQSLTLRKLAQVLSALLPMAGKIDICQNRFAQSFATHAFDVYCQNGNIATQNHTSQISEQYRVDIFAKGGASLSQPGLLVMDMDSTIIAMECIDEIAALAGVKDQVAAVTERAMQGEIPFTQSLHDRVACLAGIAIEDLLDIRNRLPFMPNFMATMAELKKADWRLAVASGGFTFFADYVKQTAQLDAAFSNQLEVKGGKLTGKVLGAVVDGAEKARVLQSLSKTYSIKQAQTVAIGDGANDLIMMQQAGTSIAYHAKPAVSAAATSAIRYCGFEGLLFSLS